jgi:hypothetical protein
MGLGRSEFCFGPAHQAFERCILGAHELSCVAAQPWPLRSWLLRCFLTMWWTLESNQFHLSILPCALKKLFTLVQI